MAQENLVRQSSHLLSLLAGPVFLARARKAGAAPEVLAWGEQILTMAVLSIILFAPLGAILIQSLGPVLLAAGDAADDDDDHKDAESAPDAAAAAAASDKLGEKKTVKH